MSTRANFCAAEGSMAPRVRSAIRIVFFMICFFSVLEYKLFFVCFLITFKFFNFSILQFFNSSTFQLLELLELLSYDEVELAATVSLGALHLVEAIGPVDTHHTYHREEEA